MPTSPLLISINADIAPASRAIGALETEIKGVGTRMNATQSGIGGMLGNLGHLAAAFGIALAFEKIGEEASAAITETTSLGNATYKLQSIVGGTTESASALLAVFERYGVGLDQASTSLGIFSKHLAGIEDFSDGVIASGKSFAQSMRELGVQFTDATGRALPMNDVLFNVADKFATLGPGADRTAIALQLFGRSGKDLIPVLSLGADGMKEAEDAAAKYGLTLTGANVKAIREYGFAQKDLQEATTGATVSLGVMLIPVLTRVQQSVAIGAQAINQQFIPALHAAAANSTHDADIMTLAFERIKRAQAGLGSNASASPAMRNAADENVAAWQRAGEAGLRYIDTAGRIASVTGVEAIGAQLLRRALGDTSPQVQLLADKLDATSGAMGRFTAETAASATEMGTWGAALGHSEDIIDAFGQHLVDQTAAIAGAYAKQKQAAIDAQVASDAANHPVTLGHAADQIQAASDAMGGTTNTLTQNSDAFAAATARSDAYAASLKKTGAAGAAAFRPFGAAIDAIDKRIASIQLGALEKAYARISQRPLDPNRPTQELGRLDLQRRILALKQTLATPYGGFGTSSSAGSGAVTPYALPPVRSSQAPNTINNTVTVHTGPITGSGDEDRLADKVLDALLQGGKTANTASKQLPGA